MNQINKKELTNIIACPICKTKLEIHSSGLYCPVCKKEYRIEEGVPILLPHDSAEIAGLGKEYFIEKGSKLQRIRSKYKFLTSILDLPDLSLRGNQRKWEIENFYRCSNNPFDSDTLILNLGSGIESFYEYDNFINFDITHHKNVDVVGDGHFLPFLDNALDGIYCNSVLEHVRRPWEIADEMFRVVKKGGFVFIHVPFIFPYHGVPNDFYRYTDMGLRELFRKFDEIDCYPNTAPTIAMIFLFGWYISIFFNNKYLAYLAKWSINWLLRPLKYLDYLLRKKEKAYIINTGYTFLGIKP